MHLERMALILEIVGQKGEASVADICAQSQLPKPTAYRLVNDLTDAGMLDPVTQGRYQVGNRLRRITEPDQSDPMLVDTIGPVLREAADTHGAAFFLSRLRGSGVEIIHVETPDTGVSFLHPGLGKRPLHACSCSKAIAAFSPEMAANLSSTLKAYTDATITDHDDIDTEFDRIRRSGYAECVEELERGLCSVAAPLGPDGHPPILSIGATGSLRVFNPTFRARMGARLIDMANDVSQRLGWTEPDSAKVSA